MRASDRLAVAGDVHDVHAGADHVRRRRPRRLQRLPAPLLAVDDAERAEERIAAIEPQVAALGWDPLQTELMLLRGNALGREREFEASEQALTQAAERAIAIGDDRLAIRALLAQANYGTLWEPRARESLRLIGVAEALAKQDAEEVEKELQELMDKAEAEGGERLFDLRNHAACDLAAGDRGSGLCGAEAWDSSARIVAVAQHPGTAVMANR